MEVAPVAVGPFPAADEKAGAGASPQGTDTFWTALAESLAGAASPGPVPVDPVQGRFGPPHGEPPVEAPAEQGTAVLDDEEKGGGSGETSAWVVVAVPAGSSGRAPTEPGSKESPSSSSRDTAPERGDVAEEEGAVGVSSPLQVLTTGRLPDGEVGMQTSNAAGATLRHVPESPPGARPMGDRSRAERLWGFWARRGKGGEPGVRTSQGNPLEQETGVEPDSTGIRPFDRNRPLGETPGPLSVATPPDRREAAGTGRDPKEARGGTPSPGATEVSPGRASAPASGSPEVSRPHAGRPVEQTAQAVRLAVHRGGERVTVQLEPKRLGRVHVEVVREGGGLSAQIRVETPQAHQLLAAELPALRAAAEARQVPLIHVTVELDQGQGRGEGGDSGPRRRHRRAAGAETAEEDVSVGTAWMPWGFEARI